MDIKAQTDIFLLQKMCETVLLILSGNKLILSNDN